MPFAYTVCSLNHVPFAMALARSILKKDPDARFFIGLIDQVNGRVELPSIEGIEFITVERLAVDGFDQMCRRYTVFELACACKPFFAKYIFDRHSTIERLFYFDTDILVFSSLTEIDGELNDHNLILTPHITAPLEIKGRLFPNDENFTGAGIYNAGFFGLRRSDESFRFLAWWSERLKIKATINFEKGWFVDQSWLSLAPLLFEGVHIERGPQYNAAYWNLHERELTDKDGEYLVNGMPLVFYHFSGFRFDKPGIVSVHQNRVSFETHPILRKLFDEYRFAVIAERLSEFAALGCAYASSKPQRLITNIRGKIAKRLAK